jgi:transcriptional regulator
MYMPPAFHEKGPDVLWDIVRSHSLGLLISQGESEIIANQVPFEVIRDGENAKLCAHVARANGQWQNLDGQNVLIVFQGANAYVSPQWYQSKREHGRVVPTWNYAVVQVRGVARVIEDKQWLLAQVSRVTNHHEKSLGKGTAWKVTDAPEDFIQSQLKGIVGIEINVKELTGKLKASQNRSAPDRAGVIEGLEKLGREDHLAMAGLVRHSKT